MEVRKQTVDAIREAMVKHCPSEKLALTGVDIFFGPTPVSSRAALAVEFACYANADEINAATQVLSRLADVDPKIEGETLANFAGRLAAHLVGDGLEQEAGWGTLPCEDAQHGFWFDYLAEPLAVPTIHFVLNVIAAAVAGKPNVYALWQRARAEISQLALPRRPNNESRVLIEAARRRDVPFLPLCDYPSLWQFGWGARSAHFWVTSSNGDGLVAGHISRYKNYHKKLFRSLGLPTPAWRVIGAQGDPAAAAKAVGFPCAVKPADGGSGKGVNAGIRDTLVLRRAVAAARQHSRQLLIEAHEPGFDHRLMVVDGRLAMAVRREPPMVTGDGERTIGMLISALNAERKREADEGGYLKEVPQDDGLQMALTGQGLALDSIIPAGQTVALRTNANHSTGGTCSNVLDQVHPEIAAYAEQLAAAVGFRVVGIDYITPDISKSHAEAGGGFIEINATPGMQVLISSGIVPEDVVDQVLGSRPGRIPICFIVAGSDEVEAILTELLVSTPRAVGIAAERQAWLGSLALPNKDQNPVQRVEALLRYPSVEGVIILWSAETLRRYGMPVDAAAKVMVSKKGLPPEWLGLLRQRSTDLSEFKNLAAVARSALQIAVGSGSSARG